MPAVRPREGGFSRRPRAAGTPGGSKRPPGSGGGGVKYGGPKKTIKPGRNSDLGPKTPGQKIAASKSPAFAMALRGARRSGTTSVGDYMRSRTPARGMAPKPKPTKEPRPPRAGKPPVSTMPVGPKPKKAPRTKSK